MKKHCHELISKYEICPKEALPDRLYCLEHTLMADERSRKWSEEYKANQELRRIGINIKFVLDEL